MYIYHTRSYSPANHHQHQISNGTNDQYPTICAGVRERWYDATSQCSRTIRVFRALEKHYGDSTTPKMINWQIPIVSGPYIPSRVQRGYDIVELRMHYWRNGVEVLTEDWWEMNLFVPFDESILPTEFTFHRWDDLAPTASSPHPSKVSATLSRATGQ
ncbi:hypothetical protein BC567DRAFT_206047 [Phyllosticta citribraziliensis]